MAKTKKLSGKRGRPTSTEALWMRAIDAQLESISKALTIQEALNKIASDNFKQMTYHARGYVTRVWNEDKRCWDKELPEGNYRAISELHAQFLKGGDAIDQMAILLEEKLEQQENTQAPQSSGQPTAGSGVGNGAVFSKESQPLKH